MSANNNGNVVETDVLIVGAGPAGALASLLLSNAGVRNILINKYKATSPGPRSHITNQRAMEILRDLNLEEAAKTLATPQQLMGEHVFATSLCGEELGRIYAWSTHPTAKAAHDLASPCSVCDLPQLYFEPLIVSQCALRGSDVRFQTEYLTHSQDSDGVTATVRDVLTNHGYAIRARYLIGADGARSKVAEDLGLPFQGQMALGDSGSINVEFTADLGHLVQHRPSDMYWMLQSGSGFNGTGVGVLRMVRPWSKWVCVWGYELAKGVPTLSNVDALSIVQKIIGTATIPIAIDAISTWTINQQYAASNTKGRVFCMGDAVHRHTPMGGLGLNTSMQDAYNLCWKLALVLKGKAKPALLKSYDQERSPVAKQIVTRAFASLATLPPMFEALGLPPSPTESDMQESLKRVREQSLDAAHRRSALRKAMDATIIAFGGGHGVEMNQRYDSCAVAMDGSPDPGFSKDENLYYQASSRPGAHLPHVWLTENQRRVSTLDLCGGGVFTLLTGLSGAAWRDVAAKVAEALHVDIRVHVIGIGQQYVDTYGDFARASEVSESGALLVRPDNFIAWRAPDASSNRMKQLLPTMQQVLGLELSQSA